MSTPAPHHPGKLFRLALEAESPLQIAGVPSAFCALLAQQAGFKALYLSGAAVSNMLFARPDLGLNRAEDMINETHRITAVSGLPLLVDIDTGFGDTAAIQASIQNLERANAAAVHLEDQVENKRCGHRPGKQLVSISEMQSRLDAACQARDSSDFVIMARTDAYSVEGLEAAIARSQAYLERGADMIFIEALRTLDEYQTFCRAITAPVLANMTEFGQTPIYSREQMASTGVSMLLYPLSAFRVMSQAALDLYLTVRQQGSQQSLIDKMQSREELYELLNYHQWEEQQDQLLNSEEEK